METLLNSKSFLSCYLSFFLTCLLCKIFKNVHHKRRHTIGLIRSTICLTKGNILVREIRRCSPTTINSTLQSLATEIPETIQMRFPGALVYMVENVLPQTGRFHKITNHWPHGDKNSFLQEPLIPGFSLFFCFPFATSFLCFLF